MGRHKERHHLDLTATFNARIYDVAKNINGGNVKALG